MKYLNLSIVMFLFMTISFQINAQNQSNSQRLQQLPSGHQLRSAFNSLSPQARVKSENWLNNLSFPDEDFNSINIDNEGGVFYADPVPTQLEEPRSIENTLPNNLRVSAADIFTLHSKPGASKVVHLDFDGHNINNTIWNNETGQSTLFARPYDSNGNDGSFSTSEIDDMAAMWHSIAEDFSPFDIDVTTEPPTGGYGPNVGHILVTHRTDSNGNNLYANSAGGVAYINVWGLSNFTYYQPALVFYNHLGTGNTHNVSEASTHELGHNLALSHDGSSSVTYYEGHGSGNTSWAPIMGVGYYKNVTQWSNGNYNGANNTQDDLNIIANRLGYSNDDHGNTINIATELIIQSDGLVNVTNPENDPDNTNPFNKGIIETSDDMDVFSFDTSGGQVTLTVRPSWEGFNYGTYRDSNLDIKATLYNSSGSSMGSYSYSSETHADISINLNAGTYYLGIEGESSSNYNDYGSIGKYYISGTIIGGSGNGVLTANFISSVNDRAASFTDTSTDSDGSITSWSWDFGDGNTSTEQHPVHNYTSDGDFTVSLTVTDNDGATNSTSQTVTTCLDTDGDGICDDLDVCQGGDDTIDTDGDGTPDFCDSCNDLIDTDGDGISDCTDSEINSPCPNNVDVNGVSLDSDGDGVCDDLDICPGSDDTLDSDVDGTPDGCDSCPLSATGDSDGDGVCDNEDICPGGDDTVDTDGDGIPDDCDDSCVPDTANFGTSTLTHSGSGSNSTSITIPIDGQDISFTISDFNQRTGGKPTNRYIEEVTVSYIDGQGANQNYGVFSGSSSVSVNISGVVQSVTVSLTDGYDGNTSINMSVNLSTVDFCIESGPCTDSDGDGLCDSEDNCPNTVNANQSDIDGDGIGDVCDSCDDLIDSDGDGVSDCTDSEINSPCPNNVDANGVSLDSDGDGVCDDNDICSGFDDNVDLDENGIPDGCDVPICIADTISFNPNTLTHSGTGSSSTSVTIPTNGQDIAFTISGIDQRTGGRKANRYIEQVTVDYVDELGSNQNYGVFSGASSVVISVSGIVQSVTVSLTDGYDGNSLTTLSVALSSVDFCVNSGSQSGAGSITLLGSNTASQIGDVKSIKVYPNPASTVINISINGYRDVEANVQLYNLNGLLILNKKLSSSNKIELGNISDGIYMLIINDGSGSTLLSKRIIVKQ